MVKWAAPKKARGEADAEGFDFSISGLTCADCAGQWERAVRELDGVKSAHLNFASGKLTVQGFIRPREVIRHAERAGYQAALVDATGKLLRGSLARPAARFWFWLLAAAFCVAAFLSRELELAWPQWLAAFLPPIITLEKALYAGAVFYAGYYPLKSALYGLWRRKPDANFVAVIVTAGALILGEWRDGALLITLFSLRELLLAESWERVRAVLRRMWRHFPERVTRIEEGRGQSGERGDQAGDRHDAGGREQSAGQDDVIAQREASAHGEQTAQPGQAGDPGEAGRGVDVPLHDVRPGDVLAVAPGERVGADGFVVQGVSLVEETPLSGAEAHVLKREGDRVFAGSAAGEGELYVRVEKAAEESALASALRQLEAAQGTPFNGLRWAARFSRVLSFLTILLAVVVAVVPPLVLGKAIAPWFYTGLVLLFLSLPCALAASLPAVVMSGVTAASQLGFLVTNASAFERLARAQVIAFDQSGAFTRERLKVMEIYPLQGWSRHEVLAVAAGVAWGLDDPIGEALVQAAIEAGTGMVTAEDAEHVEGGAVEATVDEKRYAVGSVPAMERRGTALTPVLPILNTLEREGRLVALVAEGSEPIAVVALAETIKDASARALRRLERVPGVQSLVMLTDESEVVAAIKAVELQVDDVRVTPRPEDRVEVIKEFQRQGKKVAVVGDCARDRAALVAADVGIALGSLDAVERLGKADALMVGDDLSKLPAGIALARRVIRAARRALWIAIGIKAAALALVGASHLTLWQAAVADLLAAFAVLWQSLRLLGKIRIPAMRGGAR